MNSVLSLLALALAPGIYFALILYGKDKYDREPKRILLAAFLLGAFSTLPAAFIELQGASFFNFDQSMAGVALYTFVVVALTEELCKFFVLRFHAYRHTAFNEPFDGIVYSTFVSLGFATAENIVYVLSNGFSTGVVRMFTAVPAHYAFGVIMGYYVGKAKFDEKNRTLNLLKGLLYATLLHGLYDFFLFQKDYPMLAFLVIGVLFAGLRIARRSIKELQGDSMFRFHTPAPVPAENLPYESTKKQP